MVTDDELRDLRRKISPGSKDIPIRFPKGIQPRSKIVKAVDKKKEGLADEGLSPLLRDRVISREPKDEGYEDRREGLMDTRGIPEHIERRKFEPRDTYKRVEHDRMEAPGYDGDAERAEAHDDISMLNILKLKMRLRAKRIIVVLVALTIVLTPIFVINIEQPEEETRPIVVNGNFNDWNKVIKLSDSVSEASTNSIQGIDIAQVGMYQDDIEIYFYLEVSGGNILEGDQDASSATGKKHLADSVYIFIDTNPENNRGYNIYDIEADYLVEIYGYNGVPYSGVLKKYNERYRTYVSRIARDPMDWNAWEFSNWITVRTNKNMMEIGFFIDGASASAIPGFEFAVKTHSSDGYYDFFDRIITADGPSLFIKRTDNSVELFTEQELVIASNRAWMFSLEMSSRNGDSNIQEIIFEKVGDLDGTMVNSILIYEDTDENNRFSSGDLLLQNSFFGFVSGFNELRMPGEGLIIEDETTKMIHIVIEIKTGIDALSAKNIGIALERSDFNTDSTVTFEKDAVVGDKLHYLKASPESIVIDGTFTDWRSGGAPTIVLDSDLAFIPHPSTNMHNFGYYINSPDMAVYLSMTGPVLEGSDVPVHTHFFYTSASDGEPLTDMDGDGRYDHNNDNLEEEYGTGDDDFDNDNIPDDVDPDMDNDMIRNGVDLEPRDASVGEFYPDIPVRLGLDIIRVYVDLDGDSRTGFNLEGTSKDTGAELLLEFRGRNGILKYSAALRYIATQSGSSGPGWIEDERMTQSLKFASDLKNMEASVNLSEVSNILSDVSEADVKFYFVVLTWDAKYVDTSNNFRFDEGAASRGYISLKFSNDNAEDFQIRSQNTGTARTISEAYMALTAVFVCIMLVYLLKIDFLKLKKR